jgi:hypothetical protein
MNLLTDGLISLNLIERDFLGAAIVELCRGMVCHLRGFLGKVTVEHVNVHTGGQAIVGSVTQSGGGRDNDEKPRTTPCT